MREEQSGILEKTYSIFRFKRRVTKKTLLDVAKAIAGATLYHPPGDPFFYIFALEGEHDLENIKKITGRDDIKKWVVLGRENVPFRIW